MEGEWKEVFCKHICFNGNCKEANKLYYKLSK